MFRPAAITLSMFMAFSASAGLAQESPFDARRSEPVPAPSEAILSQSPELWLYERERERQDNPKVAVRRKAELKAAQRAERLASQAWYGINNSRPTVNATPMLGGYQSSFWGSNTYDPSRWRVFMPYTAAVPRNRY